MSWMRSASRAWGVGLLVVAHTTTALANPDGRITGRSRTGCGTASTCHRMTAGATASIAGPMAVAPGSRSTYTLTINSTVAGFVQGGCDVTVSAGTLAVNAMQSGTRVNGVDLVHNMGLARTAGGPVTIRFDVVAPASGTFNIFAAGNATNGTLVSGDAWATATLAVTVTGGTTDASVPTDGAVRDAAVSDVPASDVPVSDVPASDVSASDVPASDVSASDDIPEVPADALVAFDPGRSMSYGGCSTAPRPAQNRGGLGVLGLVALAVMVRGRRR